MAYMVAITELDRAYAAGLIDGEGCIDIHYNKPNKKRGFSKYGQYYVRVTVHITDLDVLKWLQTKWGGSVRIRKDENIRWKQTYDWKLVAGHALEFLREISPYMKVKRGETMVALRFKLKKRGENLTPIERRVRIKLQMKLQLLKHQERGIN